MPWQVTDPDGTVHTYERRPENSKTVFVPDPRSPVPDEVLHKIAGASIRWRHGAELPGLPGVSAADLAREVLAWRAWARGACAWLECASTGAVVDLPATNVPQTAAECRALLPEHMRPRATGGA